MNDTPSLLKNTGERKNWILIKTVGRKSNRNGFGARVTVVTGNSRQIDDVRSGGSYISCNDQRLHFGLGDATKVDRAEIAWPSGLKEVFQNLKANQVITLEEGKGIESSNKPKATDGNPTKSSGVRATTPGKGSSRLQSTKRP